MKFRTESWPVLYRSGEIEIRAQEDGEDEATKLYEFSVSSEAEVERWFGMEVLSHSRSAVDLSVLRNGGALLLGHDSTTQIGVVREAAIDEEKKRLRAVVQFSRAPLAQQIRQDLEDKIRTQISIGYRVLKAKRTEIGDPEKGTRDKILVTRWTPYEVSVVSVAADQTVGVGRAEAGKYPVEIEVEEGRSMKKKVLDERGAVIEVDESDPRAALTEAQVGAIGTRSAQPPTPPAPAPAPAPAATAVAEADIQVITDRAQKRATEITVLCQRHNRLDKLAGLLGSAKGPDQIAREFLDEISRETEGRAPAQGSREARIDNLTSKDRKVYSLRKAIVNALDMRESRTPKYGLELEVSKEIEKQTPEGYARQGQIYFLMDTRTEDERYEADMRDAAIRDAIRLGRQTRVWPLDSATATEGAELKFIEPGQFIDLLRTQMYVAQMGATIFNGLQGPLTMPRQTAAVTGTWQAEEAALGANVMLALDTVALAPKTLMLNTGYTRQLLVTAAFAAEQIVRNDIAAVYGRTIDQAALHGTGTTQPLGIYGQTGVNAAAFGGTVTYAKIIEMINAVAVANANFGSLGWLATPGVASKAMQLLEIAGVSPKIWVGGYDDGRLGGYLARATNQLKSNLGAGTNEHGLVFANWAELLIGNWNALDILVDPITSKLKGIIELTAFAMVDVAVKHGPSFSKATGLIP